MNIGLWYFGNAKICFKVSYCFPQTTLTSGMREEQQVIHVNLILTLNKYYEKNLLITGYKCSVLPADECVLFVSFSGFFVFRPFIEDGIHNLIQILRIFAAEIFKI